MTKPSAMPTKTPHKPAAQPPGPATDLTQDRKMRNYCHFGAAAIVLFMLILISYRAAEHETSGGDSFTDLNVMMAGDNFAHHGFVNLHFLPVQYVGELAPFRWYYTHYPPLPEVLNGVMRDLGIESLRGQRLLCGLFAIAGVVMMYLGFGRLIGPLPAVMGLAFIATSGYFAAYATSLHHSFNLLFIGAFFFCFLKAVDSPRRAGWLWAGAWAALFLESMVSFEWYMYPQVFAWLYFAGTEESPPRQTEPWYLRALMFVRRFVRRRWPVLLLLASAPVAGFALHMVQNIWALGWAAITEYYDSIIGSNGLIRVAKVISWILGYDQYGDSDRWADTAAVGTFLWQYTVKFFYWPWPVLAVLGVLSWALLRFRRLLPQGPNKAMWLVLGVTLSPLAWYLIMPHHTVNHQHTASQLLPLAFVALGSGLALAATYLVRRSTPLWGRLALGLAILLVAYGQSVVVPPFFNVPKSGIAQVASYITTQVVHEKEGILFNNASVPAMSYYLRHNAQLLEHAGMPFPKSLDTLKKCYPPGWDLKYLLLSLPVRRDIFNTVMPTCQVTPLTQDGSWLLVDISPLLLPPDQRKPLPLAVYNQQMQWLQMFIQAGAAPQ